MKWITHQSFGIMSSLLIGLPVTCLPFVYLGSTLPDNIDFIRSMNDRRRFNQIHRGMSHFFGFYFILCAIGLFFMDTGIYGLTFSAIFGLGFGGLGHILLDFLNPSGVPYNPFKPKSRAGLGLISTHSFKEIVFLVAMLAVFFLLFDIVIANYVDEDIQEYINKLRRFI